MAHHSAAGKSTGAGQAQFVPFCPIQFARISISFHFTLSYASMSRGSSRYPIVLLIRIIKAQPQSTSHMWLLHLPIDRTRRRVWKKTPTLQLMWLICQFRPVHILGGSSLHAAWQMSKRPRANMINYSRLLRDGQVIGDNKYAIRFMQL